MWRAEDIFFGAFGGGNLGDAPITTPEQVVDSFDLHRRGLPACPFMHGTAHWMAFGTLYSGGTVVISPERHFDPEHLWRLIEAERVTFLVIVGDAFARPLVETYDELDPPADATPLTVVLSGGAVLSPCGEGGVGRPAPGHAADRRLRRVGDRRAGPERVGRGRTDRERRRGSA